MDVAGYSLACFGATHHIPNVCAVAGPQDNGVQEAFRAKVSYDGLQHLPGHLQRMSGRMGE